MEKGKTMCSRDWAGEYAVLRNIDPKLFHTSDTDSHKTPPVALLLGDAVSEGDTVAVRVGVRPRGYLLKAITLLHHNTVTCGCPQGFGGGARNEIRLSTAEDPLWAAVAVDEAVGEGVLDRVWVGVSVGLWVALVEGVAEPVGVGVEAGHLGWKEIGRAVAC